jgi:hypothetical protein
LSRKPSERVQDQIFSFGLCLFLAKNVSGAAVSGA